jgi:HEAT repeat protein
VAIDPWQSPAELSSTVVALKQWWVETGKLPPRDASHAPDPVAENSIKEALDVLRSDDPMKRTEAMAALVGHRAAALPAIREAVKRSERAGDQRSILFLEDVRWAILIPDTIEQRADGVRNALARGKSPERQSAATRLGRAGREALPALTELVNDSDPLVVESAVRALTGIGGKDAISAMAALLQAADSNLRMTAAQALGHTKNSEALKPLLTVFDDPNEVVACTALSALEEIRSGNTSYRSSSGSSLPDDIATALRHCLSDARWRVRAAAVEVIGKLSANNLTKDLKKLLDDPDGFVVKNTLAALSQLNAIPDVEQLAALSKRLPSLRGDAVEMMLISETDETARKVTEIFNASSTDEQAIILNALARRETDNEGKTNDVWKPMLTWATTATDARLRRTAAEVLGKQSSKLAAELIGPLLADEDQETRVAAANDILVILARESGASQSSRMFSRMTDSTSAKTNKAVLTPGRMTVWHAAMLQHAEQMSNLTVAAAVFVTGDGKSDLPLLVAALEKMDTRVSKRQDDSATLGLVVSRLPWPEGQPLLDKLCSSPLLYAMAARGSSRATPAVADYLLEPSRFKSVVERVNGQDLTSALQLLAGYNYDERPPWSLWSETDRTRAVAVALVESTNAAWRATAVFSLGLRLDAEKSQSVFEKAITDSNAWVRAAAVQVMTRITKDRAVLEGRLGPLLADTDLNVAGTAAVALLEPEVRQAAGLESEFNCFRFENVRGGRSASSGTSDERPLTTLENKPTFLPQARERLTATNAEASVGFALLLAQYGEFSGVDRLIAETNREKRRDVSEAILTGIALSRDAKYLPALRQMTEALTDEWELRKILQALKGMTGPDARQLRLEINKRMRNASGGVPSID